MTPQFVVISMPPDYLPPWWPTLKQRRHGSKRLPQKIKKRLEAHRRRTEEHELAMVEAWWSRWRAT